MKTAIYYFSGTGNSLYVSKKLQAHLSEASLYPIVKYLNDEEITIEEEKVVIVFPVYTLTIPLAVQDFIKKLNMDKMKYLSLVATRLGLYFDDFSRVEKIIEKKNSHVDSYFLINMPSNDIKVEDFKPLTPDELSTLFTEVDENVNKIVHIVEGGETYLEKDHNYSVPMPYGDFRDKMLLKIIPRLMIFSRWIGGVNYFYVLDKCNGCGLCEKVCLSQKISMEDSKPTWDKKKLCYMCYACINYCPTRAVQIDSIPGVKSFSLDNERYHNPYISVSEIINQKLSQ